LATLLIEKKKITDKKLKCFYYNLFQFDGTNGGTLIHVGSEFTKNQKFSIEELKDKRRRDHKLEMFLADQERRPECRRLQVNN
jgi:hypothetical protein